MKYATQITNRGLFAGLTAALLLLASPTSAWAGDTAKDLASTIQRSKSRMMGMQFDKAVAQFKTATELLTKLKADDPDHKKLAKLQKDYDKLKADLEKKIVQRAGRDINAVSSSLEKALKAGDTDQIAKYREKLTGAIDKHRANLEAAGGESGTAMIQEAEALIASDGTEPKAPEAPKPTKKADGKPVASGDAKQIYSEIQRKFRDVRGADTAGVVAIAAEIRDLIEQLRAAEPNHKKIPDFEKKVEKIVADAYAEDIRNANNEFDHRIRKINMYLERNYENERENLKEQRDKLAEALKTYRPSLEAAGDEGSKLLAETEAVLKQADERIGVALAGDQLTGEWIKRLKTYQWDGEKDITISVNSAAAHAHVTRLRAEAEKVWKEYQQVDFGAAMTDEMKDVAEKLQRAMAKADESLAYAVKSRREKAATEIKHIEDFFANDKAWKSDKSKMPKPFSISVFESTEKTLKDIVEFAPDAPETKKLQQRYAAVVNENNARLDARKSATLMKPDAYKGSDAKELRAFAKKLIDKPKYKGAKALRVTIFTPEWKEETVTEWTDTTHTALRTRTTRQLMVCVATEHSDGIFRMFGYLFQDRKSDGSWGSTYGHLTDTRNPMLKENVKKDEAVK